MSSLVPHDIKLFTNSLSLNMRVSRELKRYLCPKDRQSYYGHIMKSETFYGKSSLQIIEMLYKIYKLCCIGNIHKVLNFSDSACLSVGIIADRKDYFSNIVNYIIDLSSALGYFCIDKTTNTNITLTFNDNVINIKPITKESDLIGDTYIGIMSFNTNWSPEKARLVLMALSRIDARMCQSEHKFALLEIPASDLNKYKYLKSIIDSFGSDIYITVPSEYKELTLAEIDNYFE